MAEIHQYIRPRINKVFFLMSGGGATWQREKVWAWEYDRSGFLPARLLGLEVCDLRASVCSSVKWVSSLPWMPSPGFLPDPQGTGLESEGRGMYHLQAEHLAHSRFTLRGAPDTQKEQFL